MPVTWATGRTARLPQQGTPQGFTLLEMMVVLAILVLTAALFPLMLDHALPARRVQAGTQRLRAALRAAEVRSSLSGQPVELTVPDLQRAAGLPASTRLTLTGMDGSPMDTVTFFPDGASGGARITLTDGRKESALRVSAVTGQVNVEIRAPAPGTP